MLHVGTPGGAAVDIDPLGDFDLGLRIDVVGAALDVIDEPHPCVWITRCGPTHLTDLDQLWCPAATTALTARGFAPAFYAVTRASWTCALSGRTRVWSRPPQKRSRA